MIPVNEPLLGQKEMEYAMECLRTGWISSFLGIHEQPVYIHQGLFREEHYPVAERIARQGLYLPSGLALTEAQLEEVCRAVERILL